MPYRWCREGQGSRSDRRRQLGLEHNADKLAKLEAASDGEAIAGIRRERDKMRQRNSRLARKFGLKGRRERKGDR